VEAPSQFGYCSTQPGHLSKPLSLELGPVRRAKV
ncbi:uncharacterized protein METZ01_LOCUS366771, partial [marine metagenome]